LQLASAGDVVARLPEGLSTELGETGGGVSGGEARRLMLARAALSGRRVVLADEPTADLDRETAAEVIAALRALADRGATVIVATHDLALAAAMDRRVTLDLRQEAAA
jgi:ATP-binding cassette subfamily C protein CydD